MYVLQLGPDGLTRRLLLGPYTVFAPEGGGFMVFIVLANAPVSEVLRKTRIIRSMAFTITEGTVFMQNPAMADEEDLSAVPRARFLPAACSFICIY
ncbi:hypothetical protein OIU84_020425 [Salix udensis]|uniref:Uncharacterized protein n=1 Tax=Salix udensis TaxID=889485 RepID=A0AAD6PGZ7_9ROSI|nr:hypothetical protein OIU84_020425 [Salix udensis]